MVPVIAQRKVILQCPFMMPIILHKHAKPMSEVLFLRRIVYWNIIIETEAMAQKYTIRYFPVKQPNATKESTN